MELVERDELLGQLVALLEEAGSGDGRLAVLSGEAGIGKTSLVRALVARLPREATVLWGACDPLATPQPLGPFRDMAPIASLLDRRAPRHLLLPAILDQLTGDGPRVMVVDDVHWADEATLDALRYVGRRVDRTSGLVIVTYRDDEAAAGSPLRAVLGDLATAPGCRRVHLPPLTVTGVSELAAGHGVDPERLHGTTGGNPFYVTEVLAAPGWSVPPTVADAVLARAARLDRPARALLEVVSISPGGIEPEIATALSPSGDEALDRCLAAGMLELSGDRIAFRHELARLAVEGSVPESRRRRLHRSLLERLERLPGVDAARLVHHADAGSDGASVLRYARLAAQQASARGAHRAAADQYRRAIDRAAAAASAATDEADLVSRWAAERAFFDDPLDVAALYRRASELHRAVGNRLGEGGDLVGLARAMRRAGRSDEGRAVLAGARAGLEALPPGQALAEAFAASATDAVGFYRVEEALDFAARAEEVAATVGPAATLALIEALDARSEAEVVCLESAEGIATGERALRLAVEAGRPELANYSLVNLGGHLLVTRRYERAAACFERSLELALASDLDYLAEFARACLARLRFEQGRWTEALALAEPLADAAVAPIVRVAALNSVGRIRARRGEAGAREALDESWRLALATDLEFRWPVAAGIAEAAWLSGRPDEIAEVVGDLYARLRQSGVRWPAGELGFWLWRAGALPDPPRDVAEPFALHMAGDVQGAAAAWERIGCPYEQAEALAEGDEPAMRQALAIFVRLGAEPAADGLRERMRRSGMGRVPARPRRSTRTAPASLTRRELETLLLLENGLSNAQIAERLYITEKTAGHHVSAIISKLGVRSRGEAASAARKLGITAPET